MKATTISKILSLVSILVLFLILISIFRFTDNWKSVLDPISNILLILLAIWSQFYYKFWNTEKFFFYIGNLSAVIIIGRYFWVGNYTPYYATGAIIVILLTSMARIIRDNALIQKGVPKTE